MSSPSNLYAEKVFSEHPASLWALDDKADYISLIKEDTHRDFADWQIIGGTSEQALNITNQPFGESYVARITGDIPTGDAGQVECISPDTFTFPQLNKYFATFSIGSYIYSDSSYISGVEIGYEYFDSTNGVKVQRLKEFDVSITGKWFFVSETFDIPNDNSFARIVIKVNYISGATSTEDYKFLINGVSAGQWSEEFNSSSLGVTPGGGQNIISTSLGTDLQGIEASAYGLSENVGYYLITDNALVAKNSGVPMVYGASNVTILSPNGDLPSLMIPGLGFLNNLGKYKEYTFETWLRINSNSTVAKRIIGPIASTDGIYVDGPFISLKVGDNYGSHYIGEWVRPMLVHIKVTKNSAALLINGEQVISLNFITSDLVFPDEFNSAGKSQDWIGFYSYSDISPIELDCIAIYPYQVPLLVAKKRFVYGQGVEFPENINTAYSGTSVFIDYQFADYTNNYSYPDIGNWGQATIDNLSIENNVLSTPDYQLPAIFINNKTESDLFLDCKTSQNESDLFLTFRPNTTWNNSHGYLYFDKLEFLSDTVKAFYGVFKELSPTTTEQILVQVEDKSSSDYFQIKLSTSSIDYILHYNGETQVVYQAQKYYVGEQFTVGIDIQKFSDYFGSNVAAFFGRRSFLDFYVAGNRDLDKTFIGHIYKVGFCTERNASEISEAFGDNGAIADSKGVSFTGYDLFYNTDLLPLGSGETARQYGNNLPVDDGGTQTTSSWTTTYNPTGIDDKPLAEPSVFLIDHTASYTLIATDQFDIFELDIAVSGYWEDYVPLTYFAQYVTDAKGDSYYDLDFIQLNLNYPAPSIFVEEETVGEWSYDQLKESYLNPVQRSYTSLDNQLFTGYNDYDDLKNRAVKNYSYDTSASMVKSYVTFQYVEAGANSVSGYFTNSVKPAKTGIVEPDNAWINTKYEVVDNMLVYPPATGDFNDLAIVMHLDFKIDGILKYKVKLRNLQLSSQAFNTSANPIGTRFGVPIYPYKKAGVYFDYKSRNPFSIYKGSSPYLYLTRKSGIQLRGTYDPLINRGLSIPINQTTAENYKIIAMQAAVRYDEDYFPYAPTQIFEVQSKDALIKFYLVANHPSGKRAKIYAVNANTGQVENGVAFYWNGNIVKEPSITIKEWGFLGISFPNILDFKNTVGAIRINGPLLMNNISHYQSTNLQEVQQVSLRPWFKVKYSGPNTLDWEFWNSAYIWDGVLVLSATSLYGIDPSDIYKSYTGTNKIIVDDESIFGLNNYEYNFYQDVLWQQTTLNAV